MIPILYEKDETAFISNGLGRLRDVTEAKVTEERNGVYELDFDYPVDGLHYDDIQAGRYVAVEHDDTGDVQPFEIVSYSEPIDGVVGFHCQHISYKQSRLTVSGTNINSLSGALSMLKNSTPKNPFSYWTDKTNSTGFMASADGVPRSVRSILGGTEGSILDAYGGEYEWDKWLVKLHKSRGEYKDITVRYGVNLTEYSNDVDYSGSYTAVIPFWTGDNGNGAIVVKGNMVDSGAFSFDGRVNCVPLDLTDKFENQPTTAQLEAMASSMMLAEQPYLPAQTLKVSFIRLQDTEEYREYASLMSCKLCDTINVVFPRYNMSGRFKIVKVVYDVLLERYEEMELGTLSTSLSEALGIGSDNSPLTTNTTNIIQHGFGEITSVTTTDKSQHVTFDKTYDNAPTVVISLAGASYNRRVHVTNVARNGFDAVGALVSGTGSASVYYYWVAVGK